LTVLTVEREVGELGKKCCNFDNPNEGGINPDSPGSYYFVGEDLLPRLERKKRRSSG